MPSRPSVPILTIVIAIAAASVLPAQESSRVPAGEVRAAGVASITVEPDLALVTVQYSAAGRTPAIAGRAAAARANRIRAAIVALGIPADSMPTTGRWGRWGDRSRIQVRSDFRDTSYVTDDAFTVRVRDLALVGRVIDTALAEGAQTIANVQFLATDTEAAHLEAIRRATAVARGRAAAVAEASGLGLGRVLDIGADAAWGAPLSAMTDAVADFRANESTTIVAPDLKVTVTVSGRWELVTAR